MFHLRSLILLAGCSIALAGSNPPIEFSQARAMAHIRSLAALKSRTAGTSGESKAIRYVRQELRRSGLDIRIEPFPFTSYELDRAVLRVGGVSVQPSRIVFDPDHGSADVSGDVAFVTPATVNRESGVGGLDLSQRVVVTTGEARYSRIAARQPAAIVFVSDSEFERLKATGARAAELLIKGRVRTVTSANLVATPRNASADREIILSAHIDSAGTPGAQDNASGVAVLLELARTLPGMDLPFRLRFVFFGAEEVGLFGSRAYLDRHREDLQRCELVFNMDSVGGKDIWIDMRDGVRNVPGVKGVSRQPRELFDKVRNDLKGRWTLLGREPESPDVSNVPPWLQTAILDSVHELGYPINQGRDASSDHRTFVEAGIVATDIAIGGIKVHTPEDLPDQISPASLEKAARIVAAVVSRSDAAMKTRASSPAKQ
jgi:hypothetical protein